LPTRTLFPHEQEVRELLTRPSMAPLPPELATLLSSSNPLSRDAAWAALVAAHSRILLHVARSFGQDHDELMDRYAYVLEQLRRDDFHRLRTFADDGRARLSTWLVVVARRLCMDFERQRNGRLRLRDADGRPAPSAEQVSRQRLNRLVTEVSDLDTVPDEASVDVLERLCASQTREVLHSALETLTAADRLLVALRFEDGRSAPEIARITGLPSPFHVYRRLNHIAARLREAMVRSGVLSSTG
jgi:RNA polymerase sigma factor (sigma-70 family)